ncbi:THAP domain-containing protein 11 [Thalassophryne amazonica]|uniref:THAP domain-containing protein 11 n=1 Tax=Thalassophryne amazonica TaxID=390379 RepID=UPI001470FCB7|nr:THAP domain-containing protein 11 [Thalassophryne amazonica]
MPGFTCCVPGCYNNSHRDRELRFYTFPKDSALREVWLRNISRAGVSGCFSTFQPTTGHRVCSVHFAGGRKTYSIRVPSLFPLRGVNERKSRRGRGRKVTAAAPAPVLSRCPTDPPASPPAHGIIITNVRSTAIGAEGSAGGEATDDGGGGGGGGGGGVTVFQTGQNGEYLGTAQLPAQPQGTDYTAPISDENQTADESSGETAFSVQQPVQYVNVSSSPLDHSYSLTTGTTSAELLRKLNEQRDIIALMEVKMKEMKATIRQLRVTEAMLQEEVRERDRLLYGSTVANVRKKI